MTYKAGISLGTVNKIIERKRELEELGDQSYCSSCASAFIAAINMELLVFDMIICRDNGPDHVLVVSVVA